MSELPSGTVSLLFSDIEGSTVLLSRLGPAYADALVGQRQVLRKAWAKQGGTEMGTEGDSFFVVFSTAEDAVAAASQAQRQLAAFQWPGGEQVRVRMGIHTGTPTVHDGAYVGMDVHRAARIAGSAHGGQVVLSESTAKLVTGCLPQRVSLRDLGSHQLKDIAQPERLFQLHIDGLHSDFPPLKTLGAASSLPRPATPLVGREGELAELTALLSSPQVRLVTLTGTGGSGKTRLAIAVAERLVEAFPDGVYFVPLAAATTAEVMWTSIAEVFDVPPEGRTPPGFFDHVAHRSALFVLDNLEQIDGADTVVAELLDHAPRAVAIATSRRLLTVPAEHVHPVPPLELPDGTSQTEAEASGAVQLFVQHARKVKPSFTLTGDNAADVTAVCRRLDGLPLAVELAAARIRLLTPKALLTRLDNALDITAGNQAPSRQKTLRDAITWSYDLLNGTQQVFFRRLGVFAGGADLDAITTITHDVLDGNDPLDLIADLVDANLILVTEDEDGEPRIGMLETIRDFAVEMLHRHDELPAVTLLHAQHYAELSRLLAADIFQPNHRRAVDRYETEMDNFRRALRATLLAAGDSTPPAVRTSLLGVNLCASLGLFWRISSHATEGERWLRQALAAARNGGADVARVKMWLSWMLSEQDADEMLRLAEEALTELDMSGDLIDRCRAMGALAWSHFELGDLPMSHSWGERLLQLAEESGGGYMLTAAKVNQAEVERKLGSLPRAQKLLNEARDLARARGDEYTMAIIGLSLAEDQLDSDNMQGAEEELANSLDLVLRLGNRGLSSAFAVLLGRTLEQRGDPGAAVLVLAAVNCNITEREWSFGARESQHLHETLARARSSLPPEAYERAHRAAQAITVEEAIAAVFQTPRP